MSVVALAPPPAPLAPPAVPPLFRLSVATYHRMIADGLLTENDRTELIEGILVQIMPHSPAHDGALLWLSEQLTFTLRPTGLRVRTQMALTLAESEPIPDLLIARATADGYRSRHPGPGDVVLVVEVAVTSLEFDRATKGRAYASAGIGVYWIVNLTDRVVEVHTQPSATGYLQHRDYRPGDTLDLVHDGQLAASIAIADLLS